MEKELQSKLVEILTAIQTATGNAADFTMAQLPDIAQSYVAYGRAIAVIKLLFMVSVAVAAGLYARWAYTKPWYCKWSTEKDKRAESNWAAMIFGFSVCGLFSLFAAISATNGALVWLAPKVWLLKELAQLVK